MPVPDPSPLTPPEGLPGQAGTTPAPPGVSEGAGVSGAAAPSEVVGPPAAAQAGGVEAASDARPSVDPQVAAALRAHASTFVDGLLALDVHGPELAARVHDVSTMGEQEVSASAQLSRRMLDRSARSGSVGERRGGPEQAASEQLVRLRSEVTALDPAALDRPGRRLLGRTLGDPVAAYAERYRSSQDRITMLVMDLRTQQDELRKELVAIAGERANLWRLMGQLAEYALLAGAIDDDLGRRLGDLDATDPGRASVLRDQVQRAARQRRQDLLTHLAVCQQGYLALDVVRSNDELLVAGIDRAATTTLAALRTAVVVTDALAGQRRAAERVRDADRAATQPLREAYDRARVALDETTPR